MSRPGTDIDFSAFDYENPERVYSAFIQAIDELQSEDPDSAPTSMDVLDRVRTILDAELEPQPDDEDAFMTPGMTSPSPAEMLEEGADWLWRTNRLAGTNRLR